MAEWSFQRRLFLGVLLVCVLAILTSLGTLLSARVLVDRMSAVSVLESQDRSAARALQLDAVREVVTLQSHLLAGGTRSAAPARAALTRIQDRAATLLARAPDDSQKKAAEAVLEALRLQQAAFERAAADLRDGTPAGITRARASQARVVEASARLDLSAAALVNLAALARGRGVLPAQSAVNRAQAVLLAVNASTIVLLVCMGILMVAALNASFRKQQQARRVAEHGQILARESLSVVEAASQLKDEFLATVSHELRNPLAPILTWTQLLRSGKLDAAKTRRALEVIERNVLSQAQLIDDLVDVSRVVSGKFRLDVRPIDLVRIIQAAGDAHGPASEAKQVRMQYVLDERAGMISGDSERLQQVMWNLISNAIKFTPKEGRVQVVLQRADSHVEVIVTDSGIGISPEFLPHVFEPFRQATTGPMRRHSGLGLGLSIVRHIVELHGGEITAESEGLGKGSRITVKFPLLATVREPRTTIRRHPIARDTLPDLHFGELVGVRVLIVDDEPNASESLSVLLESCGAETRSAGSVEEAMMLFRSWRPDLLVSDIAMPDADGYELIRRIRELPEQDGGALPAVALTAHAKIEDRVTILNSGFQMYLSKPADPIELVAVLVSLAHPRGPTPPS